MLLDLAVRPPVSQHHLAGGGAQGVRLGDGRVDRLGQEVLGLDAIRVNQGVRLYEFCEIK